MLICMRDKEIWCFFSDLVDHLSLKPSFCIQGVPHGEELFSCSHYALCIGSSNECVQSVWKLECGTGGYVIFFCRLLELYWQSWLGNDNPWEMCSRDRNAVKSLREFMWHCGDRLARYQLLLLWSASLKKKKRLHWQTASRHYSESATQNWYR